MLKRYLITGLLLWVPLAFTIWVLYTLISALDQTLLLVPPQYRPEVLLGFYIPGLGVILTLTVLFFTGLFTTNFLGQRLILMGESLLARIPIVKSIYSSVKQVSETILSDTGQAFSQALLIEYPRPNLWTIAFLTGQPSQAISQHVGPDHISVYIPTTPNPTSGFFLIVPKNQTKKLNMTVDEALKYIISMGVANPDETNKLVQF